MATTDACDESKCLSTGVMPPSDTSSDSNLDSVLFNCYAQGPGTLYPYICADGLVGVPISTNEPNNLHYYTCCPDADADADPDPSPPVRECLDPEPLFLDAVPTEADTFGACNRTRTTHPFVRFSVEVPGIPRGYLCCDVDRVVNVDVDVDVGIGIETIFVDPIDNETGGLPPMPPPPPPPDRITANECYESVFCGTCTVTNSFGDLQAMNCFNEIYQYPEVTYQDGNTATYQCCSGLTDSLYVVDSAAYKATIWTQFLLALIASCMSLVLIVAVSRALWQNDRNNNGNSNHRSKPARRGRGRAPPDYSAYNLYLVFLGLPDLLYNAFMMGIVSDTYLNGWIPQSEFLITFCATSNQYLNAIIAREILVLLQRTKDCRRYSPPSHKKAGIQFGITVAYAAVVATLWYLLLYSDRFFGKNATANININSSSGGRTTEVIPWREYTMPVFYVLVVAIPGVYLLWVCFAIWWQQLLPKEHIGRRRETTATTETAANTTTTTTATASSSSSSSEPHRSLSRWNSFQRWRSSRTAATGAVSSSSTDHHSSKENATNGTAGCVTTNHTGATHPSSSNGTTNTNTTNTTNTTTTTAVVQTGRLNVLAIYFARIILVFFLIWLPGMIMYYIAYQPNKNTASLLHNIGLLFLSLQAIVSNGMAMTKPDVTKAIRDLYGVTLGRLVAAVATCCCRNRDRKPSGAGEGEREDQDPAPTDQKGDVEAPRQGHVVVTIPQDHSVGDPISTITAASTVSAYGPSHMEILPVTTEENELDLDGDHDAIVSKETTSKNKTKPKNKKKKKKKSKTKDDGTESNAESVLPTALTSDPEEAKLEGNANHCEKSKHANHLHVPASHKPKKKKQKPATECSP